MLEFEEFNLENPIELSKPANLFETVVNNSELREKGINYDSQNRSDFVEQNSNRSFNKTELNVENPEKPKPNELPFFPGFANYDKSTIQITDLDAETETPFAKVESQSGMMCYLSHLLTKT